MFYAKDHKTGYLFDPFDFLGTQRRKLLSQSWAHLFREEILSDLPVEKLVPYYSSRMGRPTKELFSLMGLLILQQMFDLTDEEAVRQFAFNIEWHYALDILSESDEEKYVCPKTLWTLRKIVTEANLHTVLFEGVTGKLAKVLSVDPSYQRLDSVHIFSNMRHLGRIGLFVQTIQKFLANLKRHHKDLFSSLDSALRKEYCTKAGVAAFGLVKPSESARTLARLGTDLFHLVERFRKHSKVSTMTSYQLLVRLLNEQCIIENASGTDHPQVWIKPNREVPSDSLQNPSDPDATYDGHKGKGYQVQIMETYHPEPESRPEEETASGEHQEPKKPPSLITHVAVEPAHCHDVHALLPAIDSAKEKRLAPQQLLADTLYGSDENCEKAMEQGVSVISPVRDLPDKERRYSLSDFSFSKHNKVTVCPQGRTPFKTRKKKRYSAVFDSEDCQDCTHRTECPVQPGKKGYYLHYDDKAVRVMKRRAAQQTDTFRAQYRYRAGVEGSLSALDRKTGIKHLRVRGLAAVSYCAFLKAAALNILRAAAFRKGTGTRETQHNRIPVLLRRVLDVFKEPFASALKFFRKSGARLNMSGPSACQWVA